jgi:hypothetical protein
MVWSVAARFSFSEAEILGMSLSRLRYWYKGHQYMDREEKAARDKVISNALGRATNGG